MKTLFSLLLTVFCLTTSVAQVSEGLIEYEMEISGDDPNAQMAASMLQGSSLKMYFSPENVLTEMSMGMMMTTKTFFSVADSSSLMLMSGMMGKKAVKLTSEDLAEVKEKQAEESNPEDYEVINTEEQKDILGYTCTKYILRSDEGMEMTYWTTKDIDVNKENVQQMNQLVEGFPLEFEINQQGMIMLFTAIDFEEDLDAYDKDELFDQTIPEGYEEMTTEELQKMGM